MHLKIPDYVGEHFEKYPLDNCGTPRPLLVCRDGMAYSVQASTYHYCSPRDSVGPWTMVEVWARRNDRWLTRGPEGWVPVERINRRIHRHGGPINATPYRDGDAAHIARCDPQTISELCTRVLDAEAALAEIREALAATDIVSLPDDYPTVKMAHDRMERIKELTLQGLAEIGRREAVEARVKVLEEALRGLMHAVCGETGFAECVRRDSGHAYPWPALEIAEAAARKALEEVK